MTCAWTETSSAETGSSQTMISGLSASAAGDADALALAAGELVRVAVDVLGVEADHVQQVLRPRLAVALRRDLGVDLERLADDVADRHARVERGVRVLEHHLDVAAQLPAASRPDSGGDVLALEA